MIDVIYLATILIAALLTGNEFAVGAFVHPALSRLDDSTHVRSVQALGKIYGRVAPFWMGSVLVLNVLLVVLANQKWTMAWWLTVASTVLFLACIVFSIVAPVPINNQVIAWNPDSLPENWLALRQRWDKFHAFRIAILIGAFLCLAASALF
jgi:uncharacterized membrane protein